ncbi:MAG: hypothetical protein ACREN8_03500 [Candidatus Dormibacteraceae bacterium]
MIETSVLTHKFATTLRLLERRSLRQGPRPRVITHYREGSFLGHPLLDLVALTGSFSENV